MIEDTPVKDPLVSVVMLTYNHEPYLAEAIEGVLRQDAAFPIELIIAEDCSTDRTREIALSYQKQYPQLIRVLYSARNVGIQQNFRRAVSAVRGVYIAFCEGDDWWHRPDKLARQMETFRENPQLAMVCSAMRYADDAGNITGTNLNGNLDTPRKAITTQEVILSSPAATCTAVAKRAATDHILRTSYFCQASRYPFSDAPLFLELVAQYACVRVEEELSTYRLSRGSASRPGDPYRRRWFQLRSYRFRCDAIRAFPISPCAEQTRLAAKWIRRRLRLAAEIGDREEARIARSDLASFGIRPGVVHLAYFWLAYLPVNRHLLLQWAHRLLKRK